jgi:hypothetical protein
MILPYFTSAKLLNMQTHRETCILPNLQQSEFSIFKDEELQEKQVNMLTRPCYFVERQRS